MKKANSVTAVILRTVRKYWLLSAGILITVVGTILAALIPPLVLGQIVDTITQGAAAPVSLIILYFGMLVLSGAGESGREVLLTVFGQKITHALRGSLMEKFSRLSTADLVRQEPGALVSRFVGDVDMVENLFTSGIISMFADACKIISILAVIWARNRGLSFILLALLPVLFLFTRYVQKHMLAAQIENRKAVARASNHVPETLHNIRTVHCLGKEQYMEQRYDTYIKRSYAAMERTNFYDAVYSPVILILNAIVVALVMLLSVSGNGKVLVLFGMSAGTAVTIINYISQIFTPVESLGMEIQTIQSAMAGIHRIRDFFALEEAPDSNISFPEQVPTNVPLVEFRDVTFSYDTRVVLNHLNLTVTDADQVTLAGRTGAGKSTVFKLLLGLYTPQEGQVLIQGVPAHEIPADMRRKLFGYVEQSFHMVPGSVADQITLYNPHITRQQVADVIDLIGLTAAVAGLENGLDTPCTPELFSQGQWQLLSIARAAVAEPKMLLFDEITANLDAETEQAVLTALKQVAKDRAVISISHRTSAELGRVITLA